MVHQVKYNGTLHEFPDEATPEMMSEALGLNQKKSNSSKKQFPVMEFVSGKNQINPLDAIKSVLIGMGKAGQNINEIGYELAGKESPVSSKKIDIRKTFKGNENPSMLENLLEGAGQYSPIIASGGLGILPEIGLGALYGSSQDTENRLGGALKGGLGASLPLIGKGVSKTYNALKPSNLFRGNLTEEQLLKNLELTKGTETGLGDVIGSPMLKRINENILTRIPFSGSNEALQRTAGKIVDKSHSIMDKLLGNNNPEEIEAILNNAVQKSYKDQKLNKNYLYKESNKLAEESNLNLPLKNFSNKAKEYISVIKDTNILKTDPEIKSILQKLNIYKSPIQVNSPNKSIILDKFGKNINSEGELNILKQPSLEEVNILKGKLGQISSDYLSSPNPQDRYIGKIFSDLNKSLKEDIKYSIKNSNNKKLIDSYEKAEKNYKENFSPFLDKQLYKFATGQSDPEMILSTFIKTGKTTDRSNLLNKLMKSLPEDKKGLIGHAYLQRALDENNIVNPLKLSTLLGKNSLGEKQFKTLFPDSSLRKELRDLVELTKKNTKGISLMQNPQTGQMNMDILPLISKSPSTLGIKSLGSSALTKLLTSEKFRENLIKKMVENSGNNSSIIRGR
jgi:hypothetical protein